jgi:hypothetical protein
VGLLLTAVRLRSGERGFVLFSGLKGALPILLGAFVILAGVPDAQRIYSVIFVAMAFSVVVQGSLVSTVAGKLGVPMRTGGSRAVGVGPAAEAPTRRRAPLHHCSMFGRRRLHHLQPADRLGARVGNTPFGVLGSR